MKKSFQRGQEANQIFDKIQSEYREFHVDRCHNLTPSISHLLLILPQKLVDDINCTLKLDLLLRRRLHRAPALNTPLWPQIHPLQILAAPCDARVQPINIL